MTLTYSRLKYLCKALYTGCPHHPTIIPTNAGYGQFMRLVRKIYAASDSAGDTCKVARQHRESRKFVLGIETSCDDTGAAVVDNEGSIIGEALNSQTKTHVQLGGIIPPIARDLHEANIDSIVNQALERANMSVKDMDAIAVTVKPGLSLSLPVGLNCAKQLARQSGKPLIPIHHMEAHALTARMIQRIDFPFMVLLASGGHCLLAVARDVDDFLLLGTCLDDSPGDTFDKTARQMKLKNLEKYEAMSGGVAIETLAKDGDCHAYPFPVVRTRIADCDFSFSGLKFHAKKIILEEEVKQGLEVDEVLPNVSDICASLQYGILKHLARRVQRAFLFCELKKLLPDRRFLVMSGGVGSNLFIREGLRSVCAQYNAELICPPPHLCTDNGIMIAWNGMEKLLVGRGILDDYESVDFQTRCPLGVDIRDEILNSFLKLPKLKLNV